MKPSITIDRVESHEGLYRHYKGQSSPQRCYLELDCRRRTLSASYDPEIGNAVPVRVWNRLAVRFGIPCLTADAANTLMDEIAADCAEICDGFERVWDGHNHVGQFTPRASELLEALHYLQVSRSWDEDECVQRWQADDWFGGLGGWRSQATSLGITAATTDAELDALAASEEREAGVSNVTVEGVRDHLSWVREKALDEAETEAEESATQ